MNFEKEIAKKLLQINAIKLSPQNPFQWASGIKSPIYCDNRITLSHPSVRQTIKEGFAELMSEFPNVNHISGVATAGIAHGALLADFLELPFSYVRSSAKKHGRQNKIEGFIEEKSNIVVVEDLISTGGSSIEAVKTLRDLGYNVLGVVSIFTYQFEKAKQNFENANCRFATLSNYSALIKEAKTANYITAEDEKILSSWNADPEAWYNNNFKK